MERLSIEVVKNATKTVNIMPETPLDKVVADCMRNYSEMRKAEEQGLLLKLPCKIEDKLYWISDQDDEEYGYEPIEEVEVCNIDYNGYSIQLWFADKGKKEYPVLCVNSIGEELFCTREEAEQALAEMKGV